MSVVTSTRTSQREELILAHLPQVRLLALRMRRRCPRYVEIDDLVSAGVVGLIQAVDRFQPEHQCQLKTLAEHHIRGAILDYLRLLDPLPRSVRRLVRERDEVAARIERHLGRPPQEAELAEALGLSIERYRRLALAVRASQTLSLDAMEESERPFNR
jgi:RNA polymerase sigma factor FliA